MDKINIMEMPLYMENFKCTGGECRETCCKNWNINIDRATYEKYEKLGKEYSEKIERNIDNLSSDFSYGHILHDREGKCIFLDEKGWCTIHAKAGEGYLSDTCRVFPRVYNIVNRVIEISGSFACPEIIDSVMNNENMLDICSSEMGGSEYSYPIHIKYDEEEHNGAMRYITKIREGAIEIIENGTGDIAQRIFIIGMILDKIYTKTNDEDEILKIIDEYVIYSRSTESREIGKMIKRDVKVQGDIVINLLKIKSGSDTEYSKWFESICENIGIDIKEREIDFEKFQSHYFTKWRKAEEKYSSIINNFLINYLYKRVFPYDGYGDIMKSYYKLGIMAAFLRFHIIGGARESSDEAYINESILKFARAIEHDTAFMENCILLLQENGINIRTVYALLKN